MSTMLSNEAQLRYVIEWFQEWSEMQRSDFLDILLEQCGPSGLVNGLVSKMESLGHTNESDRPPSLFQCRIKLFREWSHNWSQQEKDYLLLSIKYMFCLNKNYFTYIFKLINGRFCIKVAVFFLIKLTLMKHNYCDNSSHKCHRTASNPCLTHIR